MREKIYGAGDTIGGFRVVRLLGGGALGVVYEAEPDPVECEDLFSLGIRRVALKLARLAAMGRTAEECRVMVERLKREYQTLLELGNPGHPNLPDVYAQGWHDGVPFLVREYVDGPTLEDMLARQPALQPMLEAFGKLCATVAVLHACGVVHRDINPSNVVMRGLEPLLIDFSHCLPPTGARLTGRGELVGTSLYASPRAEGEALSPRSTRPYLATAADDVWSLGVILYEMLTGQVPWRSPPHRRKDLLQEMLRGPPRHPSELLEQSRRWPPETRRKLLQHLALHSAQAGVRRSCLDALLRDQYLEH